MRLSELAKRTGATVEPADAADVEIEGAAGLDEAGAGHVTFLSNPRYTPRVQTTRASAIYLAEGVEAGREIAVLRARDPYLAYTRALRVFHPEPEVEPFVHPSAVIDETARVHESARVGACVVVGRGAVVGAGVHLHPNVTIY
ncbi:MAG: LpxD N-terminal domain-containing protein, partial [Pyrinomonadaceae bacterium]